MKLPATAGLGSTMQVASKGAPAQVRATFKPKPPSGSTCREYFATCPGETAAEGEDPDGAAKVKSWPVPVSGTLCALPSALSEITMAPDLPPPAAGLKITGMVQFTPAAKVAPQVLVWEKSPTALIVERVSVMLPVLVKVTDCAALVKPDNRAGKLSEAGDKLTHGPIPVPVRLTICVLPLTPPLLSLMVTEPVSGPGATGEKVTVTIQVPPAATLLPQLLVSLKFALVAMLVMLSAAAPVLLKLTCCDTLCVPRFWLPNARLDGETPASGATPVPDIHLSTIANVFISPCWGIRKGVHYLVAFWLTGLCLLSSAYCPRLLPSTTSRPARAPVLE